MSGEVGTDPSGDPIPWYIARSQRDDERGKRIRSAAVAFAATLDDDRSEWAEDFGDWCAARYGWNDDYDNRMPSFKRAFSAYWKEPVDYGDGPVEDEDDDVADDQ